jgi:hypothetical protein
MPWRGKLGKIRGFAGRLRGATASLAEARRAKAGTGLEVKRHRSSQAAQSNGLFRSRASPSHEDILVPDSVKTALGCGQSGHDASVEGDAVLPASPPAVAGDEL